MTDETDRVPITDGIFQWPSDDPQLLGTECPSCGHVSFPQSSVCGNPDCPSTDSVESTLLSDTGTLYSYTIQRVDHKPPYDYHDIPLAIGTVELPENINLVSKLTTADTDILEIGMEMKLTVGTLYEENGTEYLTYYFEPTEDTA
jgi:uncharacterized OB-fold protein